MSAGITKDLLADPSEIEELIDRRADSAAPVIAVLNDIQERYHYLPGRFLAYVAERYGLPLARIYGIATFYNAFSLTPKGEHIIKVCLGTACHVGGGDAFLEVLETSRGIEPGETTPDGKLSCERVACLGCCALAPVVVLDDEVHGKMDRKKFAALLETIE